MTCVSNHIINKCQIINIVYINGRCTYFLKYVVSKGDMMQRLQALLGVSKEDTIAVGDGANDRSMFEHANLKVAFCAKDILKKEANAIIDTKDMRKLLELI